MSRRGTFEVTGGFLLMVTLLFYLDTENILPLAALAAGLHELGHYLVVRLMGGRIARFRLTAVGGDMCLDKSSPLSYGGELASILAGPGVNLTLALLTARLAAGREGWYLFAGLNLALGLFNLLPVYPLDGGRALLVALSLVLPPQGGRIVTEGLSALVVAFLLAAGLALLGQPGHPFTLLVMALWLSAGLLNRVGRPAGPWGERGKN